MAAPYWSMWRSEVQQMWPATDVAADVITDRWDRLLWSLACGTGSTVNGPVVGRVRADGLDMDRVGPDMG